ncbi:hypothetical protein [Rhizobium sp. RU20A]|uniref:hypothetical protein n=1 Tax=Rhizobium sp. RU20A TaxID=1907412 RepID=UPI00165FBA55|nr:hypothetical protein [Rhizobium sp. RU20A]
MPIVAAYGKSAMTLSVFGGGFHGGALRLGTVVERISDESLTRACSFFVHR